MKNLVNFMSSFDTKLKRNDSNLSIDIVPFFKEKYFLNNNFESILESYYEFIDSKVVGVHDTSHNALALGYAQTKLITDEDLDIIRELDVNNCKEMRHIIKAVSITIFTNLNELVADAIILKYFSRDVYYEIGCTYYDSMKLFDDFCFGIIASSSYGIVKSVSLGLTLVVV